MYDLREYNHEGQNFIRNVKKKTHQKRGALPGAVVMDDTHGYGDMTICLARISNLYVTTI